MDTLKPIYDINKSYQENFDQGPQFDQEIPKRPPSRQPWGSFLGHQVKSRIGVPSGPLLNADWILFAAKLGFDILTYKTIRSHPYQGHPLPNILYIQPPSLSRHQATICSTSPAHIEDVTITNSFGMPSQGKDFLIQDIQKACDGIDKGQILIVSITGSGKTEKELIEDFTTSALIAFLGGAPIIELNFSCPNVSKGGMIYQDPILIKKICSQIKKIIQLPLIIKVGTFDSSDQMTECFKAAERVGARAICGLNSVPKEILSQKKRSPFGKDRKKSGVCGAGIFSYALRFVKEAREIIQKHTLSLSLMGVGGISTPNDFDTMLKECDIALTATAMMWDPQLAYKYHLSKEELLV